MDIVELKRKLYNRCKELIEQRIAVARTAMEAAQQAANGEEKSTAGDKYDTARAMGHIDRDMNARQLSEALDTFELLSKLDYSREYTTAQPGALVHTTLGNYFISAGVGSIAIDGKQYFAVSIASPIAQALLRKKNGDKLKFNGKDIEVTQVF